MPTIPSWLFSPKPIGFSIIQNLSSIGTFCIQQNIILHTGLTQRFHHVHSKKYQVKTGTIYNALNKFILDQHVLDDTERLIMSHFSCFEQLVHHALLGLYYYSEFFALVCLYLRPLLHSWNYQATTLCILQAMQRLTACILQVHGFFWLFLFDNLLSPHFSFIIARRHN